MLPQLAVSAKILCLLMVVICGAAPSMVRSVRLYNVCTHHYLDIVNGSVTAKSSLEHRPDLNMISNGIDLKLLIHSPRENMFLCFDKQWKLVGRRMRRDEALSTRRCLFMERLEYGYNAYSSVANTSRYIGFNPRGQQVRRPRFAMPMKRQLCLHFMKQDHSFSIARHNRLLGGERVRQPGERMDRPPAGNQLRPEHRRRRNHKLRHSRRRNGDAT